MLIAHKIELDLNDRQKTHMGKAVGCARFAYNWALCEWRKMYLAWKENSSLPKPNQHILRKRLNSIKRDQFSWILEVTKYAPQQAIINLGKAFDRFFKGLGCYPRFHRKGVNDSFYIGNDQIRVDGKRLKIPNLGWVRMRERIRFTGKIILKGKIDPSDLLSTYAFFNDIVGFNLIEFLQSNHDYFKETINSIVEHLLRAN